MPLSCVTCGTSLPDDADYCPSCGRAVIRRFAGDPLGPNDLAPEPPAAAAPEPIASTPEAHHSIPLAPPTASRNTSGESPGTSSAATARTVNASHVANTRPDPAPTPRVASLSPPAKPTAGKGPAGKISEQPRRTGPVAGTRLSPDRDTREPALGQTTAWNDRWLGAVAYLTLLPAIAFVFVKQFQRRRFVRFHAVQSILFWLVATSLAIIGMFVSNFGFLLIWLVCGILVTFAIFLTWLVLSVKALQGERFHLPWLGNMADQFGG